MKYIFTLFLVFSVTQAHAVTLICDGPENNRQNGLSLRVVYETEGKIGRGLASASETFEGTIATASNVPVFLVSTDNGSLRLQNSTGGPGELEINVNLLTGRILGRFTTSTGQSANLIGQVTCAQN